MNDVRSSLEDMSASKSDKNHIHGTWEIKGFGDYGKFYYNESLRLCFLRYYRQNYKFNDTSSVKLWTLGESKYQPYQPVPLPAFNPNISSYINTDGEFNVVSSKTGTTTINISGFWICKGE